MSLWKIGSTKDSIWLCRHSQCSSRRVKGDRQLACDMVFCLSTGTSHETQTVVLKARTSQFTHFSSCFSQCRNTNFHETESSTMNVLNFKWLCFYKWKQLENVYEYWCFHIMDKQRSHSAPVTLVCVSVFGLFRKMPVFFIAIRDSYFIVCVYVYNVHWPSNPRYCG